ncbi:MAG: MgtC/SapB family protein [Pseudolabrys sp.]|nr:MgtC/SapB family protein [Pseudolabrys sp.]
MTQNFITHDDLVIVVRLLAALAIGGMIGLERSLHGRPAGFRTHSLVCLASALLMLVTVYQLHWMTEVPLDTIRADPTRMAQGIMTGIGFLGAGVIFKEGLNVRGLTTAASIWITSAIGILVGIGFYLPAILGAVLTLAVLALFRLIENKLPSEYYAHHVLSFDRKNVMNEEAVHKLIGKHGFSLANLSSRLSEGGKLFEYRMTIRSRDQRAVEALSKHLRGLRQVKEFRITPVGD